MNNKCLPNALIEVPNSWNKVYKLHYLYVQRNKTNKTKIKLPQIDNIRGDENKYHSPQTDWLSG